MSGLEIAGLVLGAFPLLFNSANGVRSVFQGVREWWQFEREFENFILDIETEHIVFSQILDILVEPLDELSQEERETLRDDPDSPLWFDLRIQTQLEHRIQKKYHRDWFMRQLRGMNDALNELHLLLPIGEVYHLDSSSLESEMFRVKRSFSDRKDKLLTDIRAKNTKLYMFLDRERAGRPSQTSTPSAPKGSDMIITSFLEFQEQARSVFRGFQRNWTCSCSCAGAHPCGISARESCLKVLLDSETEKKHIKVEVEMTAKMPEPSKPSAVPRAPTKREDVAVLRQQISLKSRLSKLKDKGPRSILKMTASSLSALSNPTSAQTDGDYAGLEKPPEKLKKRQPGGGGAPSARVVRVQFDGPPESVIPVLAPVAASTVKAGDHDQAISDMCLAIKKQDSYLGFLELQDARILLHIEPPVQSHLLEMETVEEFMKATPRRDSRLKMGLAIISTLLNLGPSWVPESWHKSSLVLLRTSESLPHPYISHPSIHMTLKTASASEAAKARAGLLTLGILLLELLFCETLERQPFRATYLSQGEPNDMTDFCTAMQWQKKVEMEFGDRLADAIRRCVNCAFGPTPDLSSSAFVQAVWITVARPVEEFCKVYSNGA